MKAAQFAAAIDGAMHPANTGGSERIECLDAEIGLSVEQLSAVIDAYELSRDERLQLARIQARLGLRAIKDGEIWAAKAFLADAIGYLERASGASR